MGAVTYPDPKVVQFIRDNMVPIQVLFDAQPIATEFNVKWTPTIITLDPEGKEHHRTVGFLPPEELIPSLMLGIAKSDFDQEKFGEALSMLDKLLKEYPRSDSAPEATYHQGVSKYKSTHDAKSLKAAYEKLQAEYPSSEWTKRAYPYRLI